MWTGTEMLIWGGFACCGGAGLRLPSGAIAGFEYTGGRYDPTTDSWRRMSTFGAPTGRHGHQAAWTGREMVVWGGLGDHGVVGSGGAYNPSTDTWRPITLHGAPSPRRSFTAVWSGTELLVWGGQQLVVVNGAERSLALADGARYDLRTDTWRPISRDGAPTLRSDYAAVWTADHVAVWTGSEMLVWGGSTLPVGGSAYDPLSDTWRALSHQDAPVARSDATAVWTGSQMIVWGGVGPLSINFRRDGATYDPATDTWTPLPIEGAPVGRAANTAVWADTQMIIWGGHGPSISSSPSYYPDGARYVPPSAHPYRDPRCSRDHPTGWRLTGQVAGARVPSRAGQAPGNAQEHAQGRVNGTEVMSDERRSSQSVRLDSAW